MKGVRGLKKGILEDRRQVEVSKWKTIAQERADEIRRKTVTQDMAALYDEFL